LAAVAAVKKKGKALPRILFKTMRNQAQELGVVLIAGVMFGGGIAFALYVLYELLKGMGWA
jgi:hypothetical protein